MDTNPLKPVLFGASIGLVLSYLFCPLFLGLVKPAPWAYISLVLSGIFAPESLDGMVGRNVYLTGFIIWELVGAAAGLLYWLWKLQPSDPK